MRRGRKRRVYRSALECTDYEMLDVRRVHKVSRIDWGKASDGVTRENSFAVFGSFEYDMDVVYNNMAHKRVLVSILQMVICFTCIQPLDDGGLICENACISLVRGQKLGYLARRRPEIRFRGNADQTSH